MKDYVNPNLLLKKSPHKDGYYYGAIHQITEFERYKEKIIKMKIRVDDNVFIFTFSSVIDSKHPLYPLAKKLIEISDKENRALSINDFVNCNIRFKISDEETGILQVTTMEYV